MWIAAIDVVATAIAARCFSCWFQCYFSYFFLILSRLFRSLARSISGLLIFFLFHFFSRLNLLPGTSRFAWNHRHSFSAGKRDIFTLEKRRNHSEDALRVNRLEKRRSFAHFDPNSKCCHFTHRPSRTHTSKYICLINFCISSLLLLIDLTRIFSAYCRSLYACQLR